MKRLFNRWLARFLLVVVAVIVYSLLAKVSLEESFSTLLSNKTAPILPTPSSELEMVGTVAGLSSESAVVSEVIDGDTIRLANGSVVRYIGIDTPETVHPTIGAKCYGSEANIANEQLVLGNEVRLERDISDTDRYGRLLRYVWLGDEMVNEKLVLDGFAVAKAYPPDTKYQALFEKAEAQAKQNNVGLWRNCTVK